MADPTTYSSAFCVDPKAPGPGQLTAGNAVPWQADFLACSVDAQPQLGWWPAQRPYQVFTKPDGTTTQFWHRGVTGFSGMVDEWHRLGVVVETRRPDGTRAFVESERRPLTG
jgi:CubicO group peptidase (beta-lactamase class C family)